MKTVHIFPAWLWSAAVAHACMECETETWHSDEPEVTTLLWLNFIICMLIYLSCVSNLNLERELKTNCWFGWFGWCHFNKAPNHSRTRFECWMQTVLQRKVYIFTYTFHIHIIGRDGMTIMIIQKIPKVVQICASSSKAGLMLMSAC